MKGVTCTYCSREARRVRGSALYPHRADLATRWFWACLPCNAHVGCHPGGDKPLGRLANAELRSLRRQVHDLFDVLWRGGSMTRSQAYAWLSSQLAISPANCHIGMFDEATCRAALSIFDLKGNP